jgi:signal transduction histidine kinase
VHGTRGSVRQRTTVGAVVVVAVALVVGAVVLVSLQRSTLRDGVASAADERASALAEQIEADGLPSRVGADDNDEDEFVVQVTDASGRVVLGPDRLPTSGYLLVSDETESGETYVVRVAGSLEDVDESTAALVPLLLVGVPVLMLVVGGTTWWVVTRALAPVERIRREVHEIGEDRLDRRVSVPTARDEIHRLATTMNAMLERLEQSRQRQRRFVSDSSHELRSPLATLRQSAEVARTHPDALPHDELTEVVLTEALRMQRLVDQMLLLARADEGRAGEVRREVDLDDLARTEAARVRRDGLTVDTSRVAAGRVLGDEQALGQVVRNLLDNAARHAATRVAVGVDLAGDRVLLSVEDDGGGVPLEERDRVFDRFVRLDEARARDDGGSGLGLAIVREISRAHGGEASLTASELGGARFLVDLPASSEAFR